jgi:hypothetical protein
MIFYDTLIIMRYAIEKDVKMMTNTRKTGIADLMRDMKVGDSFFVPASDVTSNTRSSLYMSAKNVGILVSIRKDGDGLRVFRIKRKSNTATV